MIRNEKHLINIHDKAEEAGIKNPVVIDDSLLKEMTPNPYLVSIGVSLEERLENLLGLVKANLNTGNENDTPEKKYYIPFMVLKGPLVKEDFLAVIMEVAKKDNDQTVITLSQADSGDSQNFDVNCV